MLKISKKICDIQRQFKRYLAARASVKIKDESPEIEKANAAEVSFIDARPYEQIPGPSKWQFFRSHMPGGKLHGASILEIHKIFREKYGNLMKMPGQLGRRDIVFSFDPEDFGKVFRNEGVWPIRRGSDTLVHYRKELRSDFYKDGGGLLAEQGEDWAKFRTKVNPVMMQPKTVKLYVPVIDQVTREFVEKMKTIRDPNTNELPANFEDELNLWAMESAAVIALDTRLGLIDDINNTSTAKKAIEAIKTFFDLMYKLDFTPSFWKLFATSDYKKLMSAFDTMGEIISKYVTAGKVSLDAERARGQEATGEESVLEKLLKVDPHVAHIMAMDMILAGVDTTSSAVTACLYQLAKNRLAQETLRKELCAILPNKDSPLTKDNMLNLPYLRACMKESSRLNPVIPGNFRTTGKDMVLGGYQIPEGTDIAMGSWILQLDENHFPKAGQFIPERWLRDEQSGKSLSSASCPLAKPTNPFIFLPFGFGPRMCIGKRFAELEIEVLLSRIIRNFTVEWNRPDLKFKSNIISTPGDPLQFKLTSIQD